MFVLTNEDVLDEDLDYELKEAVVELRKIISLVLAVTVFFELTLQRRLRTVQSQLYKKSNKYIMFNHKVTRYGFLTCHYLLLVLR